VSAAQNDEVWGAKVALQGVSEKGLDVDYRVERDPPFIFEGAIRCEEQLEGTNALDSHGAGRGIGDAQTEWAQVRLVEVGTVRPLLNHTLRWPFGGESSQLSLSESFGREMSSGRSCSKSEGWS
jgi:hypothetical protein